VEPHRFRAGLYEPFPKVTGIESSSQIRFVAFAIRRFKCLVTDLFFIGAACRDRWSAGGLSTKRNRFPQEFQPMTAPTDSFRQQFGLSMSMA
jgi:hypothetical protein